MRERAERSINSMPWSRTQIKKRSQKLRSLTLVTRSLGAVSHSFLSVPHLIAQDMPMWATAMPWCCASRWRPLHSPHLGHLPQPSLPMMLSRIS
jgi:hypothetical protein